MKLTVLGSSSSGNCYLLHNKKECLVLEAGISLKDVKKALVFDISKIEGGLVSHEHLDHSKYVSDYIRAGIPFYASDGTIAARSITIWSQIYSVKNRDTFEVGNFIVSPFDTQHDAEQPFGFYIFHPEMGSLVFATDTYYVKYRFPDVNHIMVECNYSQDILNRNCLDGVIPKSLRDRTMKSHFELENVKKFLEVNNSHELKNVILLHLSDRNSNAKKFKKECKEVTNKPTYIAESGLEIKLDLVPF